MTKERFPEADQLVYGDFKELDKYITPYDNTYYVILTRGHIGDADCFAGFSIVPTNILA